MSFLRLKLCFLQQVYFVSDEFPDEALRSILQKPDCSLGRKQIYAGLHDPLLKQ